MIKTVQSELPNFDIHGYICFSDLNDICQKHHATLQTSTHLNEKITSLLQNKQLASGNINEVFAQKLSFADKLSDKVAQFGGSWQFIIGFTISMLIWICVNSIAFLEFPFDPYPYILLNLVLSCIAALQAPFIMMSQRRQEQKDRLRSEQDYMVNLKAELEIREIKDLLQKKDL